MDGWMHGFRTVIFVCHLYAHKFLHIYLCLIARMHACMQTDFELCVVLKGDGRN